MRDLLQPITVWTNRERSRFFLVPDGEQLPLGKLVLRTLTGRELKVDPSSVAEFEVSEAEAKEWLKGEFGKMLDGTRGAADTLVRNLNEAARKNRQDISEMWDSKSQAEKSTPPQ
jgi:hypothetical protein